MLAAGATRHRYIVVGAHPKHDLKSITSALDALFANPAVSLTIIDYSSGADARCSEYVEPTQAEEHRVPWSGATDGRP